MAEVDHAAAFMRYAAERRCVSSPRGAVVRLARWHAPLAGRESSQLPPLRNRWDVRAWARDAGQAAAPRDVASFVREAERLWREFCDTLEAGGCAAEAVTAARALVDVDAPARREAAHRSLVQAWAGTFGERAVTAAQLRDVWGVREAICSATRPGLDPDEVISPTTVSRYVQRLAADAGAGDVDGWCIEDAEPERHRRVARWKLERSPAS